MFNHENEFAEFKKSHIILSKEKHFRFFACGCISSSARTRQVFYVCFAYCVAVICVRGCGTIYKHVVLLVIERSRGRPRVKFSVECEKG